MLAGELGGTASGVGELSAPLSLSEISICSPLITNFGVIIGVVELLLGGGLFSFSDQNTCYNTMDEFIGDNEFW